MKKLYFTKDGCFDIDSIVCIKYLNRESLYEVSFNNSNDHFWLNEEQYECLQNDLEDIYENYWYAECDFEYDEDEDEDVQKNEEFKNNEQEQNIEHIEVN